jgi:hypothetical protein
MESRLYEAPLAQVKVTVAGEESGAKNGLGSLQCAALHVAARVVEEEFHNEFWVVEDVQVIAQHPRVCDLFVFTFNGDEVPADVSTRSESVGEIGGTRAKWPLDVTTAIYRGIHLAAPESFNDCVYLSRHRSSLAPIPCLIALNV